MTSTPSAPSPAPSPASPARLADGPGAPAPARRAPRPLSWARLATLGGVTALFVGLLGLGDPFDALQRWLTGGGETVRMQPADEPPESHEVTHGNDLRGSLAAWKPPSAGRKLVLVLGNSQQYTASLPRGAKLVPDHQARLTSDLLADRLHARAPGEFIVMNGAAPNQTMVETLWQSLYWFHVAPQAPGILVVQSSFDTFRKTGIRAGFQTLLEDPGFANALQRHVSAVGRRSYVSELAQARTDLATRQKETASERRWSLEAALRRGLEHVPLYRRRQQLKASFLMDVYLARVAVLRVSPTTRRHITGQALAQSFDALADLVRLARARGTRVFIYNAPVNPVVDMFFPDEYRDYVERLRALAAAQGCGFADLAQAVPADQWGYWIDGPDPIHFDERGHVTLTDRLDRAFGAAMAGR